VVEHSKAETVGLMVGATVVFVLVGLHGPAIVLTSCVWVPYWALFHAPDLGEVMSRPCRRLCERVAVLCYVAVTGEPPEGAGDWRT
jgi:hypothetical protein